jgi:hypothetical protein
VASFTVIYDACLLYPPSIRDLVVELARTGLFRAKWTARINAEWINAVMRDRPELDRTRLERAAALMNSAIPDSLVSGFEQLESGLAELPDPDDRHVLAAAIHPDAFVEHVFDLNLEAASEAVRRIRRRLINPPVSAQEMIAGYESNGLAVSASILRARVNSL